MIGWLVNDCLTCISGTKTFWHDLLENINGLLDKTNNYTPYENLASKIEGELKLNKPNYIIRNASYFRRIKTDVRQISLLQDINANRKDQVDVCNNSDVVIFNSEFVKSLYPEITSKHKIIPLGTDFDLFKPGNAIEEFKADIIYIGSSNDQIKGFNKILELINSTKFTFNLVMKDDFNIINPRVKVFNKINHEKLVNIINSSKVCLCTSNVETLHLAGIECGACNIPIVATNTGIYYQFNDNDDWGCKIYDNNIVNLINYVLNNKFAPRDYLLSKGLDKKTCMEKWRGVIYE